MKITDNLDELFVVVDENDNLIGYKSRKECHSNKSLIHRSASLVIFNSKGEVALQKRSMSKDLYPGYFTLSASGHVSKGETYEETIKREMLEEIGIQAPIKFITKLLYRMPLETEFDALFTTEHEGPFLINKDEVESLKFMSNNTIRKIKNSLTPSSIKVLEVLGIL